MAAPIPYEPFLPWTEGAYYPLPSQVWLNNNGDRAAFLMQLEHHQFLTAFGGPSRHRKEDAP